MKKKCLLILSFVVVVAIIITFYGCNKQCEHEFSNWTAESMATCTQDGLKKRTCSKCGEIETAIIPAVGHNFVDGICTDCGVFE